MNPYLTTTYFESGYLQRNAFPLRIPNPHHLPIPCASDMPSLSSTSNLPPPPHSSCTTRTNTLIPIIHIKHLPFHTSTLRPTPFLF